MPAFATLSPADTDELCTHAPFDTLSRHERGELGRKVRCHAFAPDEVLFAQGQEEIPLLWLCTGLLKLSCSAAQGRECVLHVIRPNSVVDAGVLFFEGGLPYSVVAIAPGSLWAFEKSVVAGLLSSNAAFGLKLMRLMAARERLFINKLAGSQGRISVACRVSAWLLHRSRMEQRDELVLDLSRELMARLLGVTRESLSRELSRLSELGYVRVERRRILLLDKDALLKLSLR